MAVVTASVAPYGQQNWCMGPAYNTCMHARFGRTSVSSNTLSAAWYAVVVMCKKVAAQPTVLAIRSFLSWACMRGHVRANHDILTYNEAVITAIIIYNTFLSTYIGNAHTCMHCTKQAPALS